MLEANLFYQEEVLGRQMQDLSIHLEVPMSTSISILLDHGVFVKSTDCQWLGSGPTECNELIGVGYVVVSILIKGDLTSTMENTGHLISIENTLVDNWHLSGGDRECSE
jgi:hypothetical protein